MTTASEDSSTRPTPDDDVPVTEPSDAVDLDRTALRLRSGGMSFARIAAKVGFQRPTDAVNAVRRALLRTPAPHRDKLRREEAARLDAWADRVGKTTEGEQKAHKLHSIDVLRKKVLEP